MLTRVSRLNTLAIETATAEVGMTASEGAVLGMLVAAGPVLSPTRLQAIVIQSPGGLTKTLRRLEDAGYVKRRTDPDDRRSLLVELTAKGRQATERVSASIAAHYDDVLADLPASEQESLRTVLAGVLDRLEARTGHRSGASTVGGPR